MSMGGQPVKEQKLCAVQLSCAAGEWQRWAMQGE